MSEAQESGQNNANSPEYLLSETLLVELEHLSLGEKIDESAHAQTISPNTVKTRRRKIKRFFGAATRNQAVVMAIQRGYLEVNVEDDSPQYESLSPTQDIILKLAATGSYVEEIAKKLGLSRHGVNNHYAEIERKLGARSITHAIRRAFELGKFKIGEEIADPLEELENETKDLQIAVGDLALRASEVGITSARELRLLATLQQLSDGQFTTTLLMELGLYSENPSHSSKSHAIGTAASGISKKLQSAFGKVVFEKTGNNQKTRKYVFRVPALIGTPGNMSEIPAYMETEDERKRLIRAQTRRPSVQPVVEIARYSTRPEHTNQAKIANDHAPGEDLGVNPFED